MPRLLIDLHLGLWVAISVLLLTALVSGLPAALRAAQPPALYIPLQRAVTAAVALQVVIGVALLASGRRPQTALHLVYAAAALAVMPLARTMARRSPGTARWYQIGGTILLLGVLFRLLTTG